MSGTHASRTVAQSLVQMTEIVLPEDIILARGTALGLESLVKAARGEVDEIG